jgi:carbonic anhydrase/acetyltransferase-like protein (isoleucine patch superfamily)
MSFSYPVLHYPIMMVKDVTQRVVREVHHWVNHRTIYPVLRHQNVRAYKTLKPIVDDAAFISPSASIVGNVVFGHDSCAMYHTMVRNYHTEVPTRVGDGSCLLDNVSFIGQVNVGNNSLIGIGSTLDSCTVHEHVTLGSHVNVCLGVIIEQGAIVASGSTITKDTRVPANQLWAGNPAVKVGDVTDDQRNQANALLKKHVKLAQEHRHAIADHYAESASYNVEWLAAMCKKIDAQSSSVTFEQEIKVPIEGKRFLQPKVNMRLPHMQQRVTYPNNRVAPHRPRLPDWTANA